MKKLTILVGPPGAGKSSLASSYDSIYINQDKQGKDGHFHLFKEAIAAGRDIIVDRLNFNKQQRSKYISLAREAGYYIEIIVLHVPREVCFKRCVNRFGHHDTIHTTEHANKALDMFFTKYEKPTQDEADSIVLNYYKDPIMPRAIICDLDGTLSDPSKREHHVRGQKKNWKAFFEEMENDDLNVWCKDIIRGMRENHNIVLCSGRPDNFEPHTRRWLEKHKVPFDWLFMRHRSDNRPDDLIKEIILHFELKTRFDIKFCIDDRRRVVDMWRANDLVVLQCAEGDF